MDRGGADHRSWPAGSRSARVPARNPESSLPRHGRARAGETGDDRDLRLRRLDLDGLASSRESAAICPACARSLHRGAWRRRYRPPPTGCRSVRGRSRRTSETRRRGAACLLEQQARAIPLDRPETKWARPRVRAARLPLVAPKREVRVDPSGEPEHTISAATGSPRGGVKFESISHRAVRYAAPEPRDRAGSTPGRAQVEVAVTFSRLFTDWQRPRASGESSRCNAVPRPVGASRAWPPDPAWCPAKKPASVLRPRRVDADSGSAPCRAEEDLAPLP